MASVLDSPAALRSPAPYPRRPLPPLPPEWIGVEAAIPRSPLGRFVFLSLLLHALVIALFGAPVGGMREGRALWGSLEVKIARGERPAETLPAPRQTPIPFPSHREEIAAPAPETITFPPLLDRIPEVTFDSLPPLVVPPPTEVTVEPPRPAMPTVRFESLSPLPRTTPLPELAPLPAIRTPVELPAIPAPLLQPIQPLTEPLPLPQMQPIPAYRPPAEVPRIAAPLLQPIQPLPARPALPNMAPSFRPQPVQEIPAESAPSSRQERPAARPDTPDLKPPAQAPGEARSIPTTPPSPPRQGVDPRAADPSSSTYDPTKPALDLDAVRRRAGQLGTGQRALLPFPMPPVPERKSKMEELIDKARKPDCREAYKELGLAAVVPLVANEFGEGTCRW